MPSIGLVKSKSIVGLDIGSFAIKLVSLKPSRRGKETVYELDSIGYEPLPYHTIVEGSIMDPTAVADAIEHIFVESKTRQNRVIIGLSGSSVIVKRIDVQRLSSQEMHDQIMWEAKPHIPYTPEEVNIDYQVLETEVINPESVSVVLAAVKKEKLNDYINVTQLAKKKGDIVDLDCFALINNVEYNYDQYSGRILAIINIGATTTNVIIAQGGYPLFVREVNFGGNHFTELIQKELNLNYEKAEAIKRGRAVEGFSKEQVDPVIRLVFDELKNEIYKTFEFYRSSASEKKIDNILLSGGVVKMEAISDLFTQAFDIPVEIILPFSRIGINSRRFDLDFTEDMAPAYNVALGLALRGAGL